MCVWLCECVVTACAYACIVRVRVRVRARVCARVCVCLKGGSHVQRVPGGCALIHYTMSCAR